jgi:hypothetical protein
MTVGMRIFISCSFHFYCVFEHLQNHREFPALIINKSSTPSIKVQLPPMGPGLQDHGALTAQHQAALILICSWRKQRPKEMSKKGARTQGKQDGGGRGLHHGGAATQTARPRYKHQVCECACLIVTCSILVHPVLLEK